MESRKNTTLSGWEDQICKKIVIHYPSPASSPSAPALQAPRGLSGPVGAVGGSPGGQAARIQGELHQGSCDTYPGTQAVSAALGFPWSPAD